MLPTPRHSSLVSQTADILRKAIRQREWRDRLPGETQLSQVLQISRPTLRAALQILQREGLLQAPQGRARRILRLPGPSASVASGSRNVGFLTFVPLLNHRSFSLFRIAELYHALRSAGMKLQVCERVDLSRRFSPASCAELVREVSPRCWILHHTSAEAVEWFARQGHSCIVMGSCPEGIRLPSLDTDYHALGRHAATEFFRRGHRHLALVLPEHPLPGDLATAEGAREQVASHAPGAASVKVISLGERPNHALATLERAMRTRPPCTGFLVNRTSSLLVLQGAFLRMGIRVPQDASVVLRDEEVSLNHPSLSLARYSLNSRTASAKLCRMVLRLAVDGHLPPRRCLLFPRFVEGESLGPAPRSYGVESTASVTAILPSGGP